MDHGAPKGPPQDAVSLFHNMYTHTHILYIHIRSPIIGVLHEAEDLKIWKISKLEDVHEIGLAGLEMSE